MVVDDAAGSLAVVGRTPGGLDAFDAFHDRSVGRSLDGIVAALDAGIEEVEVWLEWFPEAGADGMRVLGRLRDLRARATELR